MKFIFLFATTFFIWNSIFAQDTIYTKSGENIICKILSEDSINVRYSIGQNANKLITFIPKKNVQRLAPFAAKETDTVAPKNDVASLGLGLGFDYGGLGINLRIKLKDAFSLTAGAGSSFIGMGYNIGLNVSQKTNLADNTTVPFANILYGINTVIIITNADAYNRMFKGFTFGFGADFHLFKNKSHAISAELLIPIRSGTAEQYISDLEDKGVKFTSGKFPIALSIGIRFGIKE
jgi:hypothetical protein